MVKAPKNMAYVAETLERMERGELKVEPPPECYECHDEPLKGASKSYMQK